ncbi:hypothetical protein BDW66DRAFT_128937 [Aspergillus desertorum]
MLTLAVSVLVIEAGPLDRGEDFVYVPESYERDPYIWLGLTNEPSEELTTESLTPLSRELLEVAV